MHLTKAPSYSALLPTKTRITSQSPIFFSNVTILKKKKKKKRKILGLEQQHKMELSGKRPEIKSTLSYQEITSGLEKMIQTSEDQTRRQDPQ